MKLTPERRVKHWRELRGIKQFVLARRAKIDAARLCRIENGQTDARAEEIERLAKALDLTMPEFYGDIPEARLS